ncbi:hypothetical protein HOK021_16850 [Streptomyces hygroscopicus]|nr:hypothetical protein HOK021_16850 [Streptomyces hygroscopicus]
MPGLLKEVAHAVHVVRLRDVDFADHLDAVAQKLLVGHPNSPVLGKKLPAYKIHMCPRPDLATPPPSYGYRIG